MTYKIQIDDQVRDATAHETIAIEKAQAIFDEHTAKIQNLFAAKNSARAKLKVLGLTDTEIAALLGA